MKYEKLFSLICVLFFTIVFTSCDSQKDINVSSVSSSHGTSSPYGIDSLPETQEEILSRDFIEISTKQEGDYRVVDVAEVLDRDYPCFFTYYKFYYDSDNKVKKIEKWIHDVGHCLNFTYDTFGNHLDHICRGEEPYKSTYTYYDNGQTESYSYVYWVHNSSTSCIKSGTFSHYRTDGYMDYSKIYSDEALISYCEYNGHGEEILSVNYDTEDGTMQYFDVRYNSGRFRYRWWKYDYSLSTYTDSEPQTSTNRSYTASQARELLESLGFTNVP